MSTLKLKGSTSGYVELTAPATAGDNTITLPTTAGSVVVADGSGNLNISGIITATTFSGDVTGSVTATNLTVNGNAYPSAGPLSNRNKIINGKLQVDQYDVSVTADNFFVDRWKYSADSSSKATVVKDNQSPVGFQKSIFVTSSSAYSVPSGETYKIRHCIEGYNIVDLLFGTANAKSITLSFYVRSSLTGTFGGALRNSGGSRSYPFTYSISSANTWEYKTIIIPGDTSGTWNGGNGIGIEIDFGLAVGSTYSGTAGAWAGANYVSATGATSVLATNGATWYLTGVQLEVGEVATPFEHCNLGDELLRCQRYYWNIRFGSPDTNDEIGIGAQYDGTTGFIDLFPPVSMRTQPSIVVSNSANYYIAYSNGGNTQFSTFGLDSTSTGNVICISASTSRTAGHAFMTRINNASAKLAFSSEL